MFNISSVIKFFVFNYIRQTTIKKKKILAFSMRNNPYRKKRKKERKTQPLANVDMTFNFLGAQ